MATRDALNMAPELAKYLFENGGTIIITEVPKGTDFGIDLKSWNTGENFKGMKMIPPGLHFIHYSAVNELGELSPRVGFFHMFKEKELLVKKWSKMAEDLDDQEVDEETVIRFRENLKDLDKFLGPYPYDMWKPWKELTSKIDNNLMERCRPLCGYVRSALELAHCDDASRPRGTQTRKRRRPVMTLEEKEDLLLPDMKPLPGTELRLTELPDKYYPDDATPTEITQHSLDSSYALNILFKKVREPMEIIGELQLSFVCFLVGQSWDAFEHWKKLISLICRADKTIPERRAIYVEFLRTLEIQLTHVPEDLLCDIVSSNNFVYHHLRILFSNIESNPEVDGRLKSEAVRARNRLTSKFSWDFESLQDEDDDEAPVVVAIE
ncbi:protein AAR2 homolog [Diachasma alloeum]|uniref:protein AAR2 homolog n=1 Tax=Diachasma alloeum TaxID=454923 RepID=UPI00073827CB|nr:protein AAR2 homolog [Diachasma alloeum]XP_015119379.1 protein AAR2 homolog [Diachasma alloeum]